MFTAAVITVSDRCARGERPDEGGPAVAARLQAAGFEIALTAVVPDEQGKIADALRMASDERGIALVVTAGGTGLAPRDVTPEATMSVCPRLVPGIPEAMRAASLQLTPRGMLSRGAAGIRRSSLIINLPGSPKAAVENLEAVLPALEHALTMLREKPAGCARAAGEAAE